MRWGRISVNPADAADPPRAKVVREAQPIMKVWSATDVERFLSLTAVSRYHSAWLTLATTGMRRGELLSLTWSDIDLERKRLTIRKALVVVNHVPQLGQTKTGKSRMIELAPIFHGSS